MHRRFAGWNVCWCCVQTGRLSAVLASQAADYGANDHGGQVQLCKSRVGRRQRERKRLGKITTVETHSRFMLPTDVCADWPHG